MSRKNYGKEVVDDSEVSLSDEKINELEEERERIAPATPETDSVHKAGWGILSFLIPLAGLILYLKWKKNRRKTASVCGKCAIASAIIGVVLLALLAFVVS